MSENINISKIFIEKGFLLDREMLDFLNQLGDKEIANEVLNKIAVVSQKKVITKSLVNENIEKIKPLLFELDNEKKKLVDKYFVNVQISVEVKKERSIEDKDGKKYDNKNDNVKDLNRNILKDLNLNKNKIKILSSPVISPQKLEVKDFVKYFRNRYNFMKKILQENPALENLISIDKINHNKNFSIIGIVNNKIITKNKNIILEVEDLTGKANLLISQNKNTIYEKSKEILLDDVIGFKCSGSRDFLFVDDFFYPDCYLKEKKKTSEDVYVLFISDIHVGSKNFLEKNFNKFIDWLSNNDCDEKQKKILEKIRYLFVVGDTIEGVGVYPGQEKNLVIKDIKKQYEVLSEFYKKVPKHITIIQCAGQHDAVRIAEPQPAVGEDFAKYLYEVENLHLVSNPSLIEIESDNCLKNGNKCEDGIKILMYHGASMHGIINEIEELRLSKAHSTPAKVIKHMLLRRHLAPTHGLTIYIPNEDFMLIKEIPDIITTGDLHRTDIDSYNNILIIANSCWQSMTDFEEKMGNIPDPCKIPILNLRTREIRILDFSDDFDKTQEMEK